ncbi:MAG TPA: hypothetical protein IAB66_00420 [Candidatus Caccousia avistercoris]|nr:hypothetical protein [Candidatus Caccousia avistercoris]
MRTFKLAFSLKTAYRVNSFLYAVKQIPLLGRALPGTLYASPVPKALGLVVAILWELASVFLGKALYLGGLVFLPGILYQGQDTAAVYCHLLLFLTAAGAFTNTYMFNPTNDKYYAILLMRMDARKYTLSDYGYAILKVVVGFLPFTLLFGLLAGVPLWLCLLCPFSIAGGKAMAAAAYLRQYEKTGDVQNENALGKFQWLVLFLLLAAAYGLPALGLTVPLAAFGAAAVLAVLGGAAAAAKIIQFPLYKPMYREILASARSGLDKTKKAAAVTQARTRKLISADTAITSRRHGLEYFNELFIKRHQKILWKSSKWIAMVSAVLVLGALLVLFLLPQARQPVNEILMSFLPYFVFIMYAINRGTGFTQALFMNCDHSMLTYSFYKQPRFILKLFQIRLREIIKVNLLPALVIGGGLALLLFASGGTENPLNYAVLFVSILVMSVFFSVHYLTIYYLLQPYNAGTEMKSGTYRLVLIATYAVCYMLMQVRMDTLLFGAAAILLCAAYCAAACLLVYRLAPKTFRLR